MNIFGDIILLATATFIKFFSFTPLCSVLPARILADKVLFNSFLWGLCETGIVSKMGKLFGFTIPVLGNYDDLS